MPPASARFAWVDFVEDWPEMVQATNQLEIRLRREGRQLAADMLLRAYAELRTELVVIGREMSAFATAEMRKAEKESRVRPDTLGGGGPRLGDYLVSEPMPQQDLLPGSIGVADQELLANHVPWWITNELGSTANVGRKIFGFFYDEGDEAPPSRDEFREHPLFQVGASPVSGRGIITEPIPARHFVTESVPIIDQEWKSRVRAVRARFEGTLDAVLRTMR